MSDVHAVLRGREGVIRVWQGDGTGETVTLAEAALLCRAGDAALGDDWGDRDGLCAIDLPGGEDPCRCDAILVVRRGWLVGLLAALRRALRARAAAARAGAA